MEPGTQQLTRMARAAVDRGADLDLDGYRDFQGRAVVGAWEWDAQLGPRDWPSRRGGPGLPRGRDGPAGTAGGAGPHAPALPGRARQRDAGPPPGGGAHRAAARRLAAVLESTTDPVCFADSHGSPLYLNDAGRRLLLGAGGTEDASLLAARVLLRPEARQAAEDRGTWRTGKARCCWPMAAS